jgi:hypothetical protein
MEHDFGLVFASPAEQYPGDSKAKFPIPPLFSRSTENIFPTFKKTIPLVGY